MGSDEKSKKLGQRILRFAVSGALLVSASAGLAACGAEEDHVNEPAPEQLPSPNTPYRPQPEEEAEPQAEDQGGEEPGVPLTRVPNEAMDDGE